MSEEIKAEEIKNPEPVVAAPDEELKNIGFPMLDKGPAVFYDNAKHHVWIGLPLDQVNDPTMLMAAIDWSKLQTLNHRNEYVTQILKRKQFEASPEGGRIARMLKEAFRKEKSIIQ